MWPAIQELMEQFKEAVIVLDGNGEIAVVNQAAQAHLDQLGMDAAAALLGGIDAIRVIRAPAPVAARGSVVRLGGRSPRSGGPRRRTCRRKCDAACRPARCPRPRSSTTPPDPAGPSATRSR